MLEDPAFQSAFVAVSQLLGSRAKDAVGAFAKPTPDVVSLTRALGSEDRATRARVLALALAEVARRLEAQRVA